MIHLRVSAQERSWKRKEVGTGCKKTEAYVEVIGDFDSFGVISSTDIMPTSPWRTNHAHGLQLSHETVILEDRPSLPFNGCVYNVPLLDLMVLRSLFSVLFLPLVWSSHVLLKFLCLHFYVTLATGAL